jgi:dipeptidyl aminopeptidase/acylaminoacyl peptidase
MMKDIRESALYKEMEALHVSVRRPGTGQISDAAEASVAPDGRMTVFSATVVDRLEGSAPTRIAVTEMASGNTRILTFGPNSDRAPVHAPDGRWVAFLSDREEEGDFQLYLLDASSGAARSTPRVQGWVEYLKWSPDGERILLGVAGHGADIAGGQGAVTSKRRSEPLPSWMPTVESGDESYRWRSAWVYELATDTVRQVPATELNIWEANWSGSSALVGVVSEGPGEGLWYGARLARIDLKTGSSHTLFTPRNAQQLGWPSASPSGAHIAVVEALCSDRWIVAGNLRLIDAVSAASREVDTHGVDVTHTEWRSESRLLLAGHREFETVVGLYDADTQEFKEIWSSREITAGGRYITVSGYGTNGDCVLVGESFTCAPEIGIVRQGQYHPVKSFDLGYGECAKAIAAVEPLTWQAPDGIAIQGWLMRPAGSGPFPLVMEIHGGPVWHWRPRFLGRAALHTLKLVQAGYAVLFPNPRGSAGRGQAFIRHVLGEMGGADTYDYLSGIDYLIEQGLVDPNRLGVTGGSYGGFMTAWLIGQDPRFAAAVPVAPVINQVTEHLISNIPHFVELFLADHYTNPTGKYFQRSPVMHAQRVKTPTLNVCGMLDRCTPAEEAIQFHHALLENGVRSVLVSYPEEGHGVRKWPAVIDFAARVVMWFEEHLSAEAAM